jgi:HEAT repeat protein
MRPAKLVEYLLSEELLSAADLDPFLIKISDLAARRLQAMPDDVGFRALLEGLDHKDGEVRAACASRLLHTCHPELTAAMRRHLNDSEESVKWRAELHIKLYASE